MGERTLKKFDVILESKINKLILIIKLVLSTGKNHEDVENKPFQPQVNTEESSSFSFHHYPN